ncbi:hypothetical protein EGW08_018077 [Elysia chlorotica]|uniref:DUF6451 domain-containing protein n=1 Tax=Elysia chlorotica TaxID=188477 RepID=A0A433SY05_ELYCH|nr:hypothetical protein EGW08_018077 [Elysia chlorotica]
MNRFLKCMPGTQQLKKGIKAFDSVDRGVIWKLMQYYGIPHKFVNIIRRLYENSTCQVIHDGKLTDPFKVETGDAQAKLSRLAGEAAKTGLQINIQKTETMRINEKQANTLHLEGKNIKEVDKFTYLGSVVDKHGGTEEDIKSRTNKARFAFNSLRPIWNSSALSIRNKLRIFNTNVKSVLLYVSETWRTTKTNTTKLQTFINRCLKYILKVRWPQTISNEELWRRSEQTPIDIQIKKRKWGWIGHTLRKPPTDITRQSLEWNPQGKRKVGRPKQTWRRSMEAEIRSAGKTWTELKRDAQNRVRWRGLALALCSYGDPEA